MGCAGLKGQVVDFAEEVNNYGSENPQGSEFHRQHLLLAKLGQGSFGAVYAAKRLGFDDDSDLAVKVMDLRAQKKKKDDAKSPARVDHHKRRTVEREAKMLELLPPSENLVRFHDIYIENTMAYLVMEKCTCTVMEHMDKLTTVTEETIKLVLRDMLQGVATIHGALIAHRDIKADNFLVKVTGPSPEDFVIKLCDFGLAAKVADPEDQSLTGVHGTPPFMAPEMLTTGKHGAKIDVWALGVFAYVLLYGRWPYTPTEYTSKAMKAAIASGTPAPVFFARKGLPEVSNRASGWVRSLLRRNPQDRLSAREALDSRAFKAQWNTEVSMRPVVTAAIRLGAFHIQSVAQKQTSPLDIKLKAVSTSHRFSSMRSTMPDSGGVMSDESTATPVDTPRSP